MVLQGVDPDSGRVGSPTIDGTGEFTIWHVAFGPGRLYTAATALQEQSRVPGAAARPGRRRRARLGQRLFDNVAAAGGIVVASTSDGRIAQLDPTSLEEIGAPFAGINGPAQTLALDDAGRRLLVVGVDETLRIFDVATRTQLGDPIDLVYHAANTLSPSTPTTTSPCFAAMGCRPPSTRDKESSSGTSTRTHWVDAACRLAGRNLTHAEWDQHIGDLAPVPTNLPRVRRSLIDGQAEAHRR